MAYRRFGYRIFFGKDSRILVSIWQKCFIQVGFGPFVQTIFCRKVLNRHNFIKTLSFPGQNSSFDQEFLESVFPASTTNFFETDLQ
jgi:hypothetical protein